MIKNVTICCINALFCISLWSNELSSLVHITSKYIAKHIPLKHEELVLLASAIDHTSDSIKNNIASLVVGRWAEQNHVFHKNMGPDEKIEEIRYSGSYIDVLYNIADNRPSDSDYARLFYNLMNIKDGIAAVDEDVTSERQYHFFSANSEYILYGQYGFLDVLNKIGQQVRTFDTGMWEITNIVPCYGYPNLFYIFGYVEENDVCQVCATYDALRHMCYSITPFGKGLKVEGVKDLRDFFMYSTDKKMVFIVNKALQASPFNTFVCGARSITASDDSKYIALIKEDVDESVTVSINKGLSLPSISLKFASKQFAAMRFLGEYQSKGIVAVAVDNRLLLYECDTGECLKTITMQQTIANMHTHENNLFIETPEHTIIRYPIWFLHSLIGYMKDKNA